MSKDRNYILHVRNESGESAYIPIHEFNLKNYNCGLCAEDKVRLRKDIPIFDDEGNLTGKVYPAGEVWEVLTGSEQDPKALWLRQPNGDLHAWDDDPSIFDTFEVLHT